MDDVWEVADLIIDETVQVNEEQNKSFDIAESLVAQIPFFACSNRFMDISLNADIERYIYCDNFKTPAYPGSYNDQPARWVQKSFLIKKNLNRIQNKAIKDGNSK